MLAEHAAQPRVFKVLVLGTTLALQLVLRRTSSEQAKEKINKFILSFALFLVLLQVMSIAHTKTKTKRPMGYDTSLKRLRYALRATKTNIDGK